VGNKYDVATDADRKKSTDVLAKKKGGVLTLCVKVLLNEKGGLK
jgi:hypothetical protein